MREITFRGFILASLLTVILTAANVYLALKVGLTFNASIPAAIMSIAILRFCKDVSIREHCTVQTFTSAAGTLSSLVFIIPAFLMIGYWQKMPVLETMIICIGGGVLGIMFSIPLRRTLVQKSKLPFPEGVACALILEAGNTDESDQEHQVSAKPIVSGIIWAVLFSLFSNAFAIFSTGMSAFFMMGGRLYGVAADYSCALLGAGYLVGFRVGISILVGLVLVWCLILPYLSAGFVISPDQSLYDVAMGIWRSDVRVIGAGFIAVAAVWSIVELLPSLMQSIKTTRHNQQNMQFSMRIKRTEQDLPLPVILGFIVFSFVLIFGLLYQFSQAAGLHVHMNALIGLSVVCALFVMVLGFFVSSAAGYMAGLVGSSTSPISGVGIIAMLLSAIVVSVALPHLFQVSADEKRFAMGLSLLLTSFVLAIATIANDNLQDLKTGQIVGATPWRQEIALVFGVIVGAMVIPWVIDLVYQAYGFIGATLPHAGMDPKQALAAPQATLMATMVQHIVQGANEKWQALLFGIGLAIVIKLFDILVLARFNQIRLSLLAVAISVYLPMNIALVLFFGTLLSFLAKSHAERRCAGDDKKLESSLQRGTLFASGLIVGETILGVLLAAVIVVTNNASPLVLVGQSFAPMAHVLGYLAFILVAWRLVRQAKR